MSQTQKELIERTRQKMFEAAREFGYVADETLTLSWELDELMNGYTGGNENE